MGDPMGKDFGPGTLRPLHMGPLFLGAFRGCRALSRSQEEPAAANDPYCAISPSSQRRRGVSTPSRGREDII